MEDRPVVKVALNEMWLEFTENCRARVSHGAENRLETAYERTIELLLVDRKIEWGGRAKRFCMHAAAGLGRFLDRDPDTAPEVSVADVENAFKVLIPYWEKICPLPPAGEYMRSDCVTLRALFGMEMPPGAQRAAPQPAEQPAAEPIPAS